MFTGLVESVGRVRRLNQRGNYLVVTIAPDMTDMVVVNGDSISCDGACLTVVAHDVSSFEVEASQETIARSTIGQLRVGSQLHLERALRADSRFGGHFVTGHIDCVGTVKSANKIGESIELVVKYNLSFDSLVVPKGSVAIDGVSLTANESGAGWLSVNLIPYTLRATRLGSLESGDRVNLEFDILGKYALRQKQVPVLTGLTMQKLLESGW